MKEALKTAGLSVALLAVSVAVSLLLASVSSGVPRADLPAVAAVLLAVGGGGGLLALLLMRPAVLGRIGGVRGQLVGAGLIGSLLLAGMVLAGARSMFISGHDLALLLTMVLFASLLSVGFALRGAAPIARRIERLRYAAGRITEGDLDAGEPVEGHDEISALAADFNRMAGRLREAAEREREMEKARRELVAAVSHDLRTPLSAVRALVEAVADGVAGDQETADRYLASARKEIENLGHLVDDLFELSRIDAGALRLTLEEASLRDLISDTISSFRPQAERRNIRLVGEVSESVDPVLMNPPRLQRVLHNLLSNALRHTPADGTIALRAEPAGDLIRVEVSDTGEGIPPEDLDRIFEPAFRGEASRPRRDDTGQDAPGAGLGLAIARGLVEAHGGSISAESKTGAGSRFRFTLRRA